MYAASLQSVLVRAESRHVERWLESLEGYRDRGRGSGAGFVNVRTLGFWSLLSLFLLALQFVSPQWFGTLAGRRHGPGGIVAHALLLHTRRAPDRLLDLWRGDR